MTYENMWPPHEIKINSRGGVYDLLKKFEAKLESIPNEDDEKHPFRRVKDVEIFRMLLNPDETFQTSLKWDE